MPPLPRVRAFAGAIHEKYVFPARARALAEHIAVLLPTRGSVLDVGAGNGLIATLYAQRKPQVQVTCLEVQRRETTYRPITLFDGVTIPFPDNSFDSVILIDVVHHVRHQRQLLREAARVARHHVIIKDHCVTSRFSSLVLRCLDWLGNQAHPVPLPYTFLNREGWEEAWRAVGLQPAHEVYRLNLYPFPLNYFFGWPWNFIIKLRKARQVPTALPTHI